MDWASKFTCSDGDHRYAHNIHDLRRTREGRALLRELGRDYKSQDMTSRPFIGWDGEGGRCSANDDTHNYMLFGASTGDEVVAESLPTRKCLNLLLKVEAENPDAIHVAFAFDYDVNMILRDMPERFLKLLMDNNQVVWDGYHLEYIPGKFLFVSSKYKGKKTSIRVWDIFSFFGTKFTKAIEQYLGAENIPELADIEAGKDDRPYFTYDDIDEHIRPYWALELIYLVQLADKFRDLLIQAGLFITDWHGPGAIASYLYAHNGVREHMGICPQDVQDASQYAYAGGRFELFKLGRAHHKVYVYDINSAYPAAIAQLPSLQCEWREVHEYEHGMFGVYELQYSGGRAADPQPLFKRDHKGRMSYPCDVRGWYWNTETANALGQATLLRGYVLDTNGERPFGWVEELYHQRKRWQNEGIQAQWALKLGLNSLYGKMAQRKGWRPGRRIPAWHQLEWAGWVTAWTRTKLWSAICQASASNSLIACETDSVITSEPLELPLSDGLGEWDYKEYDDIVYLQSGMYWLLKDGEWKAKYRGLDPGSLAIDDVLEYLTAYDVESPDPLYGTTTRFVGGKQALNSNMERWRTWEHANRKINVGNEGKRIHDPEQCSACAANAGLDETLHTLVLIDDADPLSRAHKIPWRDSL